MDKLERILKICCDYYNQPLEKIKGKERYRQYVEVRHSYCYLAKTYTNLCDRIIGELINKDRTTVMNSFNIVTDCFHTKLYLYKNIVELKQILDKEFETDYTKVTFTFNRKINFDLFVTNITNYYGAIKYEIIEN